MIVCVASNRQNPDGTYRPVAILRDGNEVLFTVSNDDTYVCASDALAAADLLVSEVMDELPTAIAAAQAD